MKYCTYIEHERCCTAILLAGATPVIEQVIVNAFSNWPVHYSRWFEHAA